MSTPDLLPQQARENPDPHEGDNPVPWPVLAVVALMVLTGVVYIASARVDTPAS